MKQSQSTGGVSNAPPNLSIDAFAWGTNVAFSVLIVFVNKVLISPQHGYGFVFATSLCALHFFVSGLAVRLAECMGYGQRVALSLKDVFVFSLVAGTSVASLNLSLLVNSVGFYQISKLLIIPFVCAVESLWLKKRYSVPVLMAVLVVVVGVGVVTVTDMSMNLLGFCIAMVSVVSSGMQQIMCGTVQRKFGISSTQLLSNTAPVQGTILLVVGPFIDKAIAGEWVTNYKFSAMGLECLALSCAVAVLVNISQFMCLGRFTALTFQVLGHTKTVLVLLVGWLYLHDSMNPRKLAGMGMAVLGMVAYGWLNSRSSQTSLQPRLSSQASLMEKGALQGQRSETVPLLAQELGEDAAPEKPVQKDC